MLLCVIRHNHPKSSNQPTFFSGRKILPLNGIFLILQSLEQDQREPWLILARVGFILVEL